MLSNSKIIVSQKNDEIRSFLINNGRAERLFIAHKSEFNIGDIVLCRVQKVKKDLDAVFVELNKDTIGFLPIKDVNYNYITNRNSDNNIKENDTIVAMITKEAVKTKPISLSCKLSIQGNYSVVHTDGTDLSVSSKLSSQLKKELYDKFLPQLPDSNLGYILRTNSYGSDEEIVINEIKELSKQLNDVLAAMFTRTVYSKLYEATPAFISQIRTIDKSLYEEIITDNNQIYDWIYQCINSKISLYTDSNLPLSALYSLEKHYQEATHRKINLSCGGYIIIDPCEALTVIDVNSGKALSKTKEDNIKLINKEAAEEISRQLILRNISGIIIIDFINFSNKENENEFITLFKAMLRNDPVSVRFIDITPLGLVEITRQKRYASIYDNIKDNL